MPANPDNVKRLVKAAWTGMEIELASQNASAEDVVNAAVNVASGAIDYCIAAGETEEDKEQNRLAIRVVLQQLMLKTTNNLKVF